MNLNHTLIAGAIALVTIGSASAQTAAPVVNPLVTPAAQALPMTNAGTNPTTQQAPQATLLVPTLRPDGKFRGVLGLGAAFASGNATSSSLSLNGSAVRATLQDKVSLYGLAVRNSAKDQTTGNNNVTAEQLRLGGRYDYNINPLMFGFGGLDLERNKLANLSLRSQATVGLGYHMINTPVTTWDLFGGLAYSSDKYIDPMSIGGSTVTSHSYPSLLLAEESAHILSATTTAKQRLVVYPNMKDHGEYRATFDAGLAVAMSRELSLNVGLGATFNSQPGLGRKSTDTLLTTGVSVKFD